MSDEVTGEVTGAPCSGAARSIGLGCPSAAPVWETTVTRVPSAFAEANAVQTSAEGAEDIPFGTSAWNELRTAAPAATSGGVDAECGTGPSGTWAAGAATASRSSAGALSSVAGRPAALAASSASPSPEGGDGTPSARGWCNADTVSAAASPTISRMMSSRSRSAVAVPSAAQPAASAAEEAWFASSVSAAAVAASQSIAPVPTGPSGVGEGGAGWGVGAALGATGTCVGPGAMGEGPPVALVGALVD